MMSSLAFYPAALSLLAMLAATGFRVVRGTTPGSRILALDTLVLVLIGLLTIYSYREGVSYYLDAALILALLGFLATLAAARFYGSSRVF